MLTQVGWAIVVGVLKGWDQLMNMVLDDSEETVRDPITGQETGKTRTLGLAVLRGTALTVINPVDGFEQIEKYVSCQRRAYPLFSFLFFSFADPFVRHPLSPFAQAA